MTLHVPTIILTAAVMSILIAGLQFFVSHRLQNQALRYWAVGNLAVVSGGILLSLRPELPLALSVVGGNGLVFLGLGLLLSGVRVFDGRGPSIAQVFGITLLGTGLLWLSLRNGDDLGQRIVIASLTTAGWCVAASIVLFRPPKLAQRSLARNACAALLFLLGVTYAGRAAAVADGWISPQEAFSGPVQAVLVLIGVALNMSWNFSSLYMVLDRLASTDGLTGLLNRRTIMRSGLKLFDDCVLRGRAISVLMVDLDHFKSINDRFGHQAGDTVLCRFADVAAQCVDAGGLTGRLGGEEFCIILPGADAQAAADIGERLRHAAEQELRALGELSINATATLGVATLPSGARVGRGLSGLMRAADNALYRAKAEGRNRVRVARWPFEDREPAQPAYEVDLSAQPEIRPL